MSESECADALFRAAVAAIDAGDVDALEQLLAAHPRLLRDRLETPGAWLRDKVGRAVEAGGFFERPYLLWLVAEDPVRNNRLPANIADVARTIIEAAKREGVATLQEQLDYALRLVGWSWVARECGVQLALIDALVDAGASVIGITDDALVNHNVEAAERLLERGAPLTLATALCLGRWDQVPELAETASEKEKRFALVLTALNGKAEGLTRLIPFGVDVNRPSDNLYSHGTPLHHAVCSGSIESVKVLVEAGAEINVQDKAWKATPLGWAEHYVDEHKDDERSKQFGEIAAYLRKKGGRS